jgi:hypothetical protein
MIGDYRSEDGPLPNWVVATATLLTVPGGVTPTVQGFQMLLTFVTRLREKCPAAPPATLRMVDGATDDVIELEGVTPELAESLFAAWIDRHTS